MKNPLKITLGLGGATLTLAIGAALAGVTPVMYSDTSTGAYTVPVFDSSDGTLQVGQWATLEDGKSVYVHTADYFGPDIPSIDKAKLTEVHLIGHQDYGTYKDVNGVSYVNPINSTEATKIYSGQTSTKPVKLEVQSAQTAEAAIANTASKSFAGRNLVTSSTTDISITSGEMITYGGFNNTNSLNSMSLSCTSGTVIKANTGVVLSGAGNAHYWAVVGASTGTNTCTITSTSSAFFLVQEANYTGTSNDTSVIDGQTTSSSCTSTTSCSTSVTTNTDQAWPTIFAGVSSGAPGAGAGTTLRVTDSNGVGLGDSNAGVSVGSNALVLTRPANSGFAVNMIAIKPAASVTVDPNDTTIKW